MPSSIHYLQPLWLALYNRAAGDIVSGGLFDGVGSALITGFFNARPPSSTATVDASILSTMPYVVYNVASATPDPTFTVSTDLVTFRTAVYVAAFDKDPSNSYDPLVCGAKIVDRLVGDWSSQATRTPTYGFDRFSPTLSGTSWVATAIAHKGVIENHEPGRCYCWVLDFELWCSKASS